MNNKSKAVLAVLAGCILSGCTCYNTHVPGRRVDHGPNPGGIDMFFCNLDYVLFPPEQGYVVTPAQVVVAAPATVVIPEYGYDWWQGTWVPRYQDWYWYHGTWVWGGHGHRPVPPAWAPDFKRRPMPPAPPRPAYRPKPRPANRPEPRPANRPEPRPANRPKPRPANRPEPRPAVVNQHNSVSSTTVIINNNYGDRDSKAGSKPAKIRREPKNTPAKKVQTVSRPRQVQTVSRPTANSVNRSGAANKVVRPGAVMRTSSGVQSPVSRPVRKEKVSAANADPGQSRLKRPVSISR